MVWFGLVLFCFVWFGFVPTCFCSPPPLSPLRSSPPAPHCPQTADRQHCRPAPHLNIGFVYIFVVFFIVFFYIDVVRFLIILIFTWLLLFLLFFIVLNGIVNVDVVTLFTCTVPRDLLWALLVCVVAAVLALHALLEHTDQHLNTTQHQCTV